MEQESRVFGELIQYLGQYETRSEEEVDEAVEIQNVSNEHSPSAKVLHIRSFPYGDEEENDNTDDSDKSVDLSEVKGQDGEDLFDEEAVKVTAAGIASSWSPYDGYRKSPDRNDPGKSWSSIDTLPNRNSRKEPNADVGKSWSSIDSVQTCSKDASQVRDAYIKSRSSIDSARAIPPRDDEEIAGSANVVATNVDRSNLDAEEKSKEADSLLTLDIVREVQRLSRFVKLYERKRAKQQQKEAERNEKSASKSNEVRSISKCRL